MTSSWAPYIATAPGIFTRHICASNLWKQNHEFLCIRPLFQKILDCSIVPTCAAWGSAKREPLKQSNDVSLRSDVNNWLWPLGHTQKTFRWRHNDHDGGSNHQSHGCLLNRLFRRKSKKTQSSASLAFVWGIHRDRWIPRTKGQLRGKCFHLMTSSWYNSDTWHNRLNGKRHAITN